MYNLPMNIKELENKTILLFGKSRAFSSEEFASQMSFHKISVVDEYSDDVALMVDGKMMTPYEQNASDALYEQKKVPLVPIDLLEKELAEHIDADTLLMSLKLSHDKERLKGFLKNSMISDALFLRLLKMYSWGGEDFFENDDNRDVTAALIVRFYNNIERNHNVQYATLGLMHLIVQCRDEALIEAIASLQPLQKSFKNNDKDANYKIITSIATHFITPPNVLSKLVRTSNSYVKTLIAMRANCPSNIQTVLYESGEEDVLEALSYNADLDKNIAKKLIVHKIYAANIARYIRLDDEIFDIICLKQRSDLAHNETLTLKMQKALISTHDENIMLALSLNRRVDKNIIEELFLDLCEEVHNNLYANINTPKEKLEQAYKNKRHHQALASNTSTPEHILNKLSESNDSAILEALAKNPSTPVAVLYQLQLDSRYERYVKENPAFGKHIQTENIGWEV